MLTGKMKTTAARIAMVVDFEGVHLDREFQIMEVGWCSWDGVKCGCYHYYPKKNYRDLTVNHLRTVNYVRKHIHGLSYIPRKEIARSSRKVEKDIRELYDKCKDEYRTYVAYKGGIVEKNFLSQLNIPSINLECLECPIFNDMLRLTTVASCGEHDLPLIHHCPKVECYHFVQWLRAYLGLPRDSNYVNYDRVAQFM